MHDQTRTCDVIPGAGGTASKDRALDMSMMQTAIEATRLLVAEHSDYGMRLARDSGDIRAAQALRYKVFNLELGEGLPESCRTGLDADRYDETCDHLVVEHRPTGETVGTYRLQTGMTAAAGPGYYSEQEFDFSPFESVRREMVELGRACVEQKHRNRIVLGLLWKGIADYSRSRGARYLCGCSSLTSTDPAAGAGAYAELCRQHLAPAAWRTKPWPAFECSLEHLPAKRVKIPKLLLAYLNIGARICGPPAIDRLFGTIDFLTWIDLANVPASVQARYLSERPA